MLQPLSHIPGSQRVPHPSEVQQSPQRSVTMVTVEVHKGPRTLLSVWNGFSNETMLKLKAAEGLEFSRLWMHLKGDLPKKERDTRVYHTDSVLPRHWHPWPLGGNESLPTVLYQTAGTWYSPRWHRRTRLDPLQEMMRSQWRVPVGSDNSFLERSPWQQCNEEMNGLERMGANREV